MWTTDEVSQPIILDNGSYSLKVGIAGEDVPRHEIRSVLSDAENAPSNCSTAEEWDASAFPSTTGRDTIVNQSDFAFASSSIRPIIAGRIVNWDAMESLWRKTFDDVLRVSVREQPLLITESPLNPNADRQRMAEILFEKFEAPAL